MSIHSTGLGHDKHPQRRSRAASSEPLVVTPRETCRLLAIGNTRLYALIAARELQSYRDGRSRRITMESIRARIARLLAEHSSVPQPRQRGRLRKHIAGGDAS
jgi:excisionase family DNA binding protein